MFKKRLGFMLFTMFLCLFIFSYLKLNVHAEGEILRVAFNSNAILYHYIDEDGEYRGMHIDMMNWIAKAKKMQIVYIPFETNQECINALNSRDVDVILGHRTNDRAAAGLQYTNELSSSSLCLVVPNELAWTIENSEGRQVYSAVMEYGTAPNYYMTQIGIQRYLSKGNQVSVFEALIEGEADMAIAVYDCFIFLLNKAGLKDKYTILRRYIAPVSYAMLVRKNDLTTFNILESGLTELRASGSYESIYKKWQLEDEKVALLKLIRRMTIIVVVLGCIVLAIILFNIMINRMLKRKVAEKTKELYEANLELDRRMMQIQSESRIRYGMIEFSPSGMVAFDKNYRITLINHAARRISGASDDCVGSDVRNLSVFGEILKKIEYDIFSLMRYGGKVSHPVTIELENGENKRSYRYNLYSFCDESDINNILLDVEDVTIEERKKQELFEQEKNRSLNRLIAGIAHEIKNPLMAIRTASSLLKTQGNDPEVQDAFTRLVPKEVDRINQLVEGLINYARPIKGKREMTNLAAVVRECLYLTKFAIKNRNICYKVDMDDSVFVYVNRDKIKQSLINIIMNSIESMERKLLNEPEKQLLLDISVSKDQSFALVRIRDEGVGMSEVEIKRCREPFYTTKLVGTGLGLSLVQQFMEENDGVLDIRSELACYTEVLLKFRRYDEDEKQDTDN